MASTVRVRVTIKATLHTKRADGRPVELPYRAGITGSGVVIEVKGGLLEPQSSTILTANHVLETPAIGDELPTPTGEKLVVDEIEMEIDTFDGRTCELTPVAMAVTDQRDVATAYANCDAGKVARIANRVPPRGAKVLVTGHPDSFQGVIVTEGYVSGWHDGYLVVSAPIYPGNSGGPLWYEGKIVGIMVRVNPDYWHISLSVPLKEIHERVRDTP